MTKNIFILFLMLSHFSTAFSQVTICEKNTLMYFACYSLNPDSTFSYQYIDGAGEHLGVGTYSYNKKEIIFRYDSLVSPIIEKSKVGKSLKKIQITCSYVLDSFPRLFNPVVYNNNLFFCDSAGTVTIDNYSSGPILIHNYVDSINIYPAKENCNHYNLYTHSPNDKFIRKGTVHVLERKGKSYRRKLPNFFEKNGLPTDKDQGRYVYFNLEKMKS